MEIAFVKQAPRGVAIRVERDDGAVLQIRSFDRPAPGNLPHDVIHYVVESELGLEDGFWGRIADGATFDSVTMVAPPSRREHKPKAQPRRRGRPRRKGVLEAEVLVTALNDIWTGRAEREYGSVRAYLDSLWSPRTRSRAEELDTRTIRRICERLDAASADWDSIQPGEELRVVWRAR